MGTRCSILLVEDEVGIRDAYAMLLDIEGYHVDIAVDGVDAMDHLARARYDLIITDYMMPRMDGIELARRVRGGAQNTPPRMILITAAQPTEEMARSVDLVMPKPIDVQELLDAIARVLNR